MVTPGGGNANQQTDLGLAAPTSYKAKYTSIITAVGTSITNGLITLTMMQIGSSITLGSQIFYTGSCGPGGMQWRVSGNVATKFLPKV